MLRKYMIERGVPGVGGKTAGELGEAAKASNEALARLKDIQWQYSFVAADKTFCVYLAESEDLIREHARLSGFPADRITEIKEMIDPSTESRCAMAEAASAAH
jgi:hypothetical protein